METLRLSRATFQLVPRGVEALEQITGKLERYNDRQVSVEQFEAREDALCERFQQVTN